MDTDQGSIQDPGSLHKYLYASGNPVNRIDPSGHDDMAELSVSEGIGEELDANIGQQVTTVGNRAKDVARAMEEISNAGREAEESVSETLNLTKNTTRIPSWTGKATFRVPDFMDISSKALLEVKNVAYQYLSSQILDMAYYCVANGTALYLAIRPDTVLSPEVLEAVREGFIILTNIQ